MIEIYAEKINANDDYLVIQSIKKNNNEFVKKGELLFEIESSKAIVEITSKDTGYIFINVKEEEEIGYDKPLAFLFEDINEVKNFKINSIENTNKTKKISAKALKIAKENNLNEKTLMDNNLFTFEDIMGFLDNSNNKDLDVSQKISNNKKIEIQNLNFVKNNYLNCYCNSIVENFDIDQLNKNFKLYFNNLTPYLIYKTSRILKNYPNLNSYFINDNIFNYKNINIGFTLDGDFGLKVPVINNANLKEYEEIKVEFINIMKKYILNKIDSKDLKQPTFVISDLSHNQNINFHLPFIFKNNSAIMGSAYHKALKQLNITVVYDHQVSSGYEVANFLGEIYNFVKNDV